MTIWSIVWLIIYFMVPLAVINTDSTVIDGLEASRHNNCFYEKNSPNSV